MADNVVFYKSLLENINKAVEIGRMDIIKTILSSEANSDKGLINYLSTFCLPDGNLLHHACKIGNVDLVRILLQSGIDPSIKNSDMQFPLELLLNHDAIVADRIRLAFIQQAVLFITVNNIDGLSGLLKGGVSVNSVDSDLTKNSLLHWAVECGSVEAVVKLLDCGAHVNITNAQGLTPLHEAVLKNDVGILEELLYYGADKSISATSGRYKNKTPVDLAHETNKNLLELLEQPSEFIIHQQEKQNTLKLSTTLSTSLDLSTESPSESNHLVNNVECNSSLEEKISIDSLKEILGKLSPLPKQVNLFSREGFALNNNKQLFISIYANLDQQQEENLQKFLTEESKELCGILVEFHCYSLSTMNYFNPGKNQQAKVSGIIDSKTLQHKADSYTISINKGNIDIRAVNICALQYAFTTLFQLCILFQSNAILPAMNILDWCDLPHRGVVIDLSSSRHLQLSILLRSIRLFSRLKANEIYFFLRIHTVAGENESSVTVTVGYDLADLKLLIAQCRQCGLVPMLNLDCICPPDHFTLLNEHPLLYDLLHLFSQDSCVLLSPHLTSLFCDPFTGLLATSTDQPSVPVNDKREISTNGTGTVSSPASNLTLPMPFTLRNHSEKLIFSSDVFHQMNQFSTPDAISSSDKEMVNGFASSTSVTEPTRQWGCIVEYVLQISSNKHLKKRLLNLRENSIPHYLAISTNTWRSVCGGIVSHLQDFVQNLIVEHFHGDEESNACGLLSCDWSGGDGSEAALTHSWFSWPHHIAHLIFAWNTRGISHIYYSTKDKDLIVKEKKSINIINDEAALLSHVSHCMEKFLHNDLHFNQLADCVISIDKFESFVMSALQTNSSVHGLHHSLLLLDWKILESHYWEELNKLSLSPFYSIIRQKLKTLGNARGQSPVVNLLTFYLRYIELFCRFLQVIRKSQACESSVLNKAMMTDLANRLLTLTQDGKEMFTHWYFCPQQVDCYTMHMKTMLCRLVPESGSTFMNWHV